MTSGLNSSAYTDGPSSRDTSFDNLTKLENEIVFDDSPTSFMSNRKRKSGKSNRGKEKKMNKSSTHSLYTESPGTSLGIDIEPGDIIADTTANVPSMNETSVSNSDQSFLALIVHQNKVGAAHYNTDNCVLNVYKELPENDSFSTTTRICFQCNPDKVIINAKQNAKLVEVINQQFFNELENGVETVPSSMFVYDLARRRLLNLSTPSNDNQELSETHKNVWINSILDFEDKNSIKAAGALLKYIDQNRIGIELEDSFIQAPILAVAQVSAISSLYLDNDTYLALQIFEEENHPSALKRGAKSTSKEGLSLFGQMNGTKSSLGAVKLRSWFRNPSRDINSIQGRQEGISFFMSNENLEKVLALNDLLKSVKNLTKIIGKMTSSHISVNDWSVLYKTLYSLVCIMDLCNSRDHGIHTLNIGQDEESDISPLKEVLAMINKIMDFEESKIKNKFTVKYAIDRELDEKKRVFEGLPDLMTKVAEQELTTLDEKILECNVIYLPQLGYLLSIPQYPFIEEKDGYQLHNLEFMFMNNGTLHYKSERTKDLDRLLGDSQSEICDHESGIMHRLQNTILLHVDCILKAQNFATELDCLLSIASFSKDHNLTFPEITTQKCIIISEGRHILYEMCTNQFVPNDAKFSFESGLMKLISGPNACGKSVYLKQVALIVYMAHLGAPVPAKFAEICICDSIFTRIKCVESVSINLSTFVLDLNQITRAVNNATDRSLVIIDEFGKGTSQYDGIALFTSILKHWLAKGDACPFVLAATHFHSIFKLKLLPATPLAKYQTFGLASNSDGLVYLYKLTDGYSGHSYANYVAKTVGLDEGIIKRAEEILRLTSKGKPISSVWKCEQKHIDLVERFLETKFDDNDSFQRFSIYSTEHSSH